MRAIGIDGEEIRRAEKVPLFFIGEAWEILCWKGVFGDIGPIAGCVNRIGEKAQFECYITFDCNGVLSRVTSPRRTTGRYSIEIGRRNNYSYMSPSLFKEISPDMPISRNARKEGDESVVD